MRASCAHFALDTVRVLGQCAKARGWILSQHTMSQSAGRGQHTERLHEMMSGLNTNVNMVVDEQEEEESKSTWQGANIKRMARMCGGHLIIHGLRWRLWRKKRTGEGYFMLTLFNAAV